MEIDNCAGIAITSKKTFDKNFNNVSLKLSGNRLHTYTRDQIKVCGQFDAKVDNNYP